MNAADRLYLEGFAAALDIAERAGARILQSTWGHPVRREYAATALCAFVDEVRAAMAAEGMVTTAMPLPALGPIATIAPKGQAVAASSLPTQGHTMMVSPSSVEFVGSPKAGRASAIGMGFTGDCCTTCAGFTMKRNGSCLVCTACGSTTGCS